MQSEFTSDNHIRKEVKIFMTDLHKKVVSAVASTAMLLSTLTPAFASTTLIISDNGADSNNNTNVNIENTTWVTQENVANITNNVQASSNTGDNTANKNTGGEVEISTGDATTVVSVENTVNSNTAEIDGCCEMDVDVVIAGNGADSKNNARLKLENETGVVQNNYANIKNNVNATSDTGGNEANKNTGGDVHISTGDAATAVSILNTANSNSARVGGGSGSGSLSMWILENGADSRNDIRLDVDRGLYLAQNNVANLSNNVRASAETGDNEANKNTGGEVGIHTGDAFAGVLIDNMVNFNWADLDCGCLLDVMAKIAGNGADSRNNIRADLDDETIITQNNVWECGSGDCNNVYADADTGNNEAEKNVGGAFMGDPSIETGDAETYVEIENAGNSNVVGSSGPSWAFPNLGGFSFNLNFSFSLAQLLAALGA